MICESIHIEIYRVVFHFEDNFVSSVFCGISMKKENTTIVMRYNKQNLFFTLYPSLMGYKHGYPILSTLFRLCGVMFYWTTYKKG